MTRTFDSLYADVKEVRALMGGASKSKAYAVIRAVNDELVAKGKITIAGRAPRKLIYDKLGLE